MLGEIKCLELSLQVIKEAITDNEQIFFSSYSKKWKNEIELTGFLGGCVNRGTEGTSTCAVVSPDGHVIRQIALQASEHS